MSCIILYSEFFSLSNHRHLLLLFSSTCSCAVAVVSLDCSQPSNTVLYSANEFSYESAF